MARLTFNDGEEPILANFGRSGSSDTLDNVNCINWSEGLCVDYELRLFHAQMDGTITDDEKKYITCFLSHLQTR